MALAVKHHQAGRLAQAEQIYQQVLAAVPDHADAIHLLGLINSQCGRNDVAVEYICRAIQLHPEVAVFHSNLGLAYRASQRLEEAEASFRRALELEPDSAEALYGVGVVYKDLGRVEEAETWLRKVLAVQAGHANAHNSLGILLANQGELDEAVACYRRALETNPQFVQAHTNLGAALRAQGKFQEAADCYRRALQIKPDYAEAHHNLGNVFKAAGQLDEAVACYRRALQHKPSYAQAYKSLAAAFRDQGKPDEAAECYRQALTIEPGQLLWELRLSVLCPTVMESNEAIDAYRHERLIRWNDFSERNPRFRLSELAASGCEPPLGLLYHGRDDRPMKAAYASIFGDSFPQDTPTAGTGRPRIGFVVTDKHESGFLQSMRGIFEHMDPDRFETTTICHTSGADRLRKAIGNQSMRFLIIPEPLDLIAKTIRAGRFDVLYYWEVGTDATNYFLPFLRLAPVQCTSWGVPGTSGIPQLDYYLSSKLLEPDGADDHYTERLIRADTLLTYQHRESPPERGKSREAFGFEANRHLYVCAQNLQKFHPDFDPVLAEILRRDPAGVLVLAEDQYGDAARKLRGRFALTVPDVTERIVFLPRQSYPDYLSLVTHADVLLDPFHFGGGFTTYDAFSFDKPIVTLPSQHARGRYTFACYKKMGLTDCVASDCEEYVEKAVALGTDKSYRAAVVEQIREASPQLFEDMLAVREHERIFDELVEVARSR
jgi:predicted O-linked N-acetylglucosamine transferase (SPINDLY family)